MIDPKNDLQRLKDSKEFKEWLETHEESYLSDFFCILDKDSSDDNLWQIDYYNPKEDTMTSFELPADKRKKCKLKEAESKVFKHDAEKVKELELNNIKLNDKETMDRAKEFLKEKHPGEKPTKTILILQHNKELDKPIWNLTFMTGSLNMFNAKIDPEKGDILESSLKSAMSLKKEMLPGTKKPTAS
ncbi:hypothetical protein HOF78_01265 [Candidatus Woesearchaeota archaeon]|jgi:hypothetical protein|nr:hypothetical protein [Candidatus Woesearchaeota archaeon]MBT6044987.1 hypothetical protein [Candidatus Woesearchaeota archaeon]